VGTGESHGISSFSFTGLIIAAILQRNQDLKSMVLDPKHLASNGKQLSKRLVIAPYSFIRIILLFRYQGIWDIFPTF
jgi:hypothetical protein